MKIRNGFVSNSSSSSFIISTEKFPTVRSLAKYMIKQQMIESKYNKDGVEWVKELKKRIKKLNNIDENQSVSFPSCNYDTYIRKVGDVFLVSTCNNTDWNLWNYTTRITDACKKELEEMSKNPFYTRNDEYNEINSILDGETSEFSRIGIDYYSLDKEIIGVENYQDCPNRDKNNYEYDHYIWNTVKWGKICPKCNPIPKRKDKLEQINKKSENE